MRKLVALLAVVCCCAGAATAYAATRSVKVGDNYFIKKHTFKTISVKAGSNLKFAFKGKAPHNVVVQSGPTQFSSPVKIKGSYTAKHLRAGTYVIFCQIHGFDRMHMTVKVK